MVGGIIFVVSTDNLAQFGKAPNGERLKRIQASPNFKDGRFINPTGFRQSFEIAKMKTIIPQWFTGKEQREPESPLPIIPLNQDFFSDMSEQGLQLTWLGHNTALIEIDGLRILTDPVWAERYSPSSLWGPKRFHEPPIALADLPPIDAVIISHDHFDHLDKDAVIALNSGNTVFFAPLGVGAHLEGWGVAPVNVRELDWWEETTFKNMTIAATPGVHFSGRRTPGSDNTLWATWSIIGPKHRVFYGGDTGMMDDFTAIGQKYGPYDISLIPIGAYDELWKEIHLNPEQGVRAHQMIGGGIMIPIHWGTFNLAFHDWFEPPERLVKAAAAAGIALVIPKAGQSVTPDSVPELVTWWRECK